MAGVKVSALTAASPLAGGELVYVVQSGGSARSTAADVGNAATNSVKLTGTQTVGGAKTFTGIMRLQNGAAGGALIVGADVGASTATDNARKLFQVSHINYDNEGLPYCVLRSDSNNTAASTALDIGGTGTAAAHGFPNLRFWTAPDIDQPAVTRWLIGTGGHFVPWVNATYDLGAATFRVRDVFGTNFYASNRVGVGTDTPTAALDVRGLGTIQAVRNTSDSLQMLLLQQSGTGDAVIDFLLTGVRAWRLGIDNSDGDKFKLQPTQTADFSAAVVIVDTSGNVGLGGNTSPTCAIDNNGFTKLGEAAPKIKQKKLTGTTGTVGNTVTVAHGVTQSKILQCDVIVNNSGGIGNIAHTGDPTTGNAYFSVFFDSTNVSVFVGAAGTQVASRPFRVLLTYEE